MVRVVSSGIAGSLWVLDRTAAAAAAAGQEKVLILCGRDILLAFDKQRCIRRIECRQRLGNEWRLK